MALVACAVEPPAASPELPPAPSATSEPVPGDTLEGVALRGFQLVPVYELYEGGRRYALAIAVSADTSYDLVFIGGQVACRAQQGLDRDLKEWQWVGEPDGLGYLAGRLRQACSLEPRTPPRKNFAVEPKSPDVSVVSDTTWIEQMFGEGFIFHPGYWMVFGTLALGAFVWSSVIPADVPEIGPGDVASAAPVDERVQVLRVPMAEDAVTQSLGAPSVSFELPNAATTVRGFRFENGASLYIGVVDGQVVWMHGPDPWLDQLARPKDEKPSRKR